MSNRAFVGWDARRLLLLLVALALAVLAPRMARADDEEALIPPDSSYFARRVLKTAPILSLSHKITTTIQGITFDSNYDNGSLAGVASAGTNIFNCTIYVEPGELGNRQYQFRFRMTGVAGRTVTLNIDHTQNRRPVISINGGPFRRTTAAEAPTLTQLVFTFGASENTAEVAFFFPLGYQEIHDRVSALVAAGTGGTTEILGKSFQNRDLWLVTVTDPATTDTGKRRVWVHARAHAGEVTASHTMLGILEKALENSDTGRRLRRYCIFNVVPTQNVDGVFLGLTRWDSQGIDPERQWPNPYRIPEVGLIKDKVDAFMAGPNPIEVALNLHSTVGDYADTFFFKHIRPSVTANFEVIQQRYIDALNNATPLFENLAPQTSQLSPNLFIESYFWNNWGEAVMAMTHEGHYYERVNSTAYLTDADYVALGRAMAEAMIEYFALPPLPSAVGEWAQY